MNKEQTEAVEAILQYLLECGSSGGAPEWPKVYLKDIYEGIYILKKFYDEHQVREFPLDHRGNLQ